MNKFFLPYQIRWLEDQAPLKIIEKSRQIGMTFTDAYDSVKKVIRNGARLDVWISSRDEAQARLYIEDCRKWAGLLNRRTFAFGREIIDEKTGSAAYVLEFKSGRRIYSLSSNPNALAGKRGHVKLDEFALHQDQRLLYRVAKPVTTWGGQLSVISTHRGVNSVFNQLVREILEDGNPMGFSVHTVTIQKAVEQGLVARINEKTGANESDEQFLARLEAECIDREQWQQEYCCQPADEASAFISHEMLLSAQADCMRPFEYLLECKNPIYAGVDFGRTRNLTVIDVGEQIGDVIWDRFRVDLHKKTFDEQKFHLNRVLSLPNLRRACL